MSTTLAHRPVDQSEWGIMREQGAMLVKTGFLPEAIRTPEQAVAIILKGRELNIPAMYALSNIAVIKGKPVANAELMLALIYRDHGDNAIRFTQSDAEACTVEYRRRGWQRPERFSFTIQDADRAGLLKPAVDRNGNPTAWHKYTPAMLRARCISAVARMAFADTIGGLYTPEEMGANVVATDEGEVRVTEVADAPPAITEQRPDAEGIVHGQALPQRIPANPELVNLKRELYAARQELERLSPAAFEQRPTNEQIAGMSSGQLQMELQTTRMVLRREQGPDESGDDQADWLEEQEAA